jgi:hypothetical protein
LQTDALKDSYPQNTTNSSWKADDDTGSEKHYINIEAGKKIGEITTVELECEVQGINAV